MIEESKEKVESILPKKRIRSEIDKDSDEKVVPNSIQEEKKNDNHSVVRNKEIDELTELEKPQEEKGRRRGEQRKRQKTEEEKEERKKQKKLKKK